MKIALTILLILLILFLLTRRTRKPSAPKTADAASSHDAKKEDEACAADSDPMACGSCGTQDDCAKKRQLTAWETQKLYFDDEELDRYKGTPSDGYSEEAVEEFREVLYTMQPSEVADWVNCLQLRGIELPLPLREETIMLIGQ